MNTNKLLLAIWLLFSLAFQIPASGTCSPDENGEVTSFGLQKDENGYYIINDQYDYDLFLTEVKADATGKFEDEENLKYSTLKARLMADITIDMDASKTIGYNDGSSAIVYCGEFDGNGHTIKMNLTATSTQCSLFEALGGFSESVAEVKRLAIEVNDTYNRVESANFAFAPLAKYAIGTKNNGIYTYSLYIKNVRVKLPDYASLNSVTNNMLVGMIGSVGISEDNTDLVGKKMSASYCITVNLSSCLVENPTKSSSFPKSYFVGTCVKTNESGYFNGYSFLENSVACYSSEVAPSSCNDDNPEYPIMSYSYDYSDANTDIDKGLVNMNAPIDGVEIATRLISSSDIYWGVNHTNTQSLPVLLNSDNKDNYELFEHTHNDVTILSVKDHNYDDNDGVCTAAGNGFVHFKPLTTEMDDETKRLKPVLIKTLGEFLSWVGADSGFVPADVVLEKRVYDLSEYDYVTLGNNSFTNELSGNDAVVILKSTGTPQEDSQRVSGLFCGLEDGAKVHDLTIQMDLSEVTGERYDEIGVLANYASGTVSVENVTVRGKINLDCYGVGGLIGRLGNDYSGAIVSLNNCLSEVEISSTDWCGGLVGILKKGELTISNSAYTGNISSAGSIGGLVGWMEQFEVKLSIDNSYTTGSRKLSGENAVLGSFLGYYGDAALESCPGSVVFSKGFAYYNDEITIGGETTKALPSLIGNLKSAWTGNNSLSTYYYLSPSEEDVKFSDGTLCTSLNGELQEGATPIWSNGELYPELAIGGQEYYRHGDVYTFNNHEYNENGICSEGENCFVEPAIKGDTLKFIIQNAGNLCWLNENWDSVKDNKHPISIVEDISLLDMSYQWTPKIELNADVYGNGKTITLSERESEGPCSLFKDVDSDAGSVTIKDMTLYCPESRVTGTGNFGILFNEITHGDEVLVRNVNFYGSAVTDASNIGAIAGSVKDANVTVKNSISTLTFYPSETTGDINIGSYFGSVKNARVSLNQCISYGNIESTSSESSLQIGGFVGVVNMKEGDNNFSMVECASHGDLKFSSSKSVSLGGLIGSIVGESGGFSVHDCYSSGGQVMDKEGGSGHNNGLLFGSISVNLYNENNVYNSFAFIENGETKVQDYSANFPIVGDIPDYAEQMSIEGTQTGEKMPTNAKVYSAYHSEKNESDPSVTRFIQGEVMYNLTQFAYIEEQTPTMVASSSFSQKIGEQKYPKLRIELDEGEDQQFAFKTCMEGIYINDNRFSYDEEKGEFVYDHEYNSMHICKLGHVDPDYNPEEEVFVSETEDLVDLVDNLTIFADEKVPVKVTVSADIQYSDVDYSKLTLEQIEASLPAKNPVGSAETPFLGTVNGACNELINYAFSQNGLFGQVGKTVDPSASQEEQEALKEENKNVKIENFSISNGLVYNTLANVVVEVEEGTENKTYYAAVLANVNNGVMEYCSFVGAMTVPEGTDLNNVVPCLVGQNNGSVNYSFVYLTNLEQLQALKSDGNKAAILVKSNSGVGRNSGSSKKVAANTTSNYTVDDNGQSAESKEALAECSFSNAEFASGVVAYWLNFEGEGYTGNYTCKYAQDKLTPKLSDGTNAIHRVVYASNNKSAIITGDKAYANAGSTLDLIFSEPVSSVKINDVEATKVSDTNYKVTIPNVSDADVTVTVSYTSAPTAMETLNPDKSTVVATSEGIRVFGALGQQVTVYSVNGSVVYSAPLESNVVALPTIVRGVYFVKVGNTTTKVVL